MIIGFEDGKMIVVHVTGHCDVYDKAHFQRQVADEELRLKQVKASIAELKTNMVSMDNSVEPKMVAKVWRRVKCTWEKTFG